MIYTVQGIHMYMHVHVYKHCTCIVNRHVHVHVHVPTFIDLSTSRRRRHTGERASGSTGTPSAAVGEDVPMPIVQFRPRGTLEHADLIGEVKNERFLFFRRIYRPQLQKQYRKIKMGER